MQNESVTAVHLLQFNIVGQDTIVGPNKLMSLDISESPQDDPETNRVNKYDSTHKAIIFVRCFFLFVVVVVVVVVVQ